MSVNSVGVGIGCAVAGLCVGALVTDVIDEKIVKNYTNYEENMKLIKSEMSADKFERISECIDDMDYEIKKVFSVKDIADCLKNGVSFDDIANAICEPIKQVK